MTIKFYAKKVYGNLLYYVADKKLAAYICCLTGKFTIDDQDMTALKGLGHDFEMILSPEESNKFQNWIQSGQS